MVNTIFNIDTYKLKQSVELKNEWIEFYSDCLKDLHKRSPLDKNLIRETEELLEKAKEERKEEVCEFLVCYLKNYDK